MTNIKAYTKEHYRIDSFLIWGHGFDYLEEILGILSKPFEILYIKKQKIKNTKKFINQIYSHDYAPIWHLKEKIKYLTQNEITECCLVIVKNINLDWDYFGENDFRHGESILVNKIKNKIRNLYNPRDKSGLKSENHVIHACDNEFQTLQLSNLFQLDVRQLISTSETINLPYYLKNTSNHFEIKTIELDKIKAKILTGDDWINYTDIVCNIEDTPHYRALESDFKIYEDYVAKFLGGPITEYYHKNRFERLLNSDYLTNDYPTSFILVKHDKVINSYIILDGLHRAASLKFKKIDRTTICILN